MGKRNPDELLQDGTKAAVELTESDLDQAAGGTTTGTAKDKQTTANKNAAAVKALL